MTVTTFGSRFYNLFIRFLMILRNSDPEFLELMSGVLGVLWGFQLLNPVVTTFDLGLGWAIMRLLAPEEQWGTLYAMGGAFQIISLIALPPRYRIFAALGGATSWGLVAGMVGAANPFGTGVVVYSVIAVSQVWAMWRVALEAP